MSSRKLVICRHLVCGQTIVITHLARHERSKKLHTRCPSTCNFCEDNHEYKKGRPRKNDQDDSNNDGDDDFTRIHRNFLTYHPTTST